MTSDPTSTPRGSVVARLRAFDAAALVAVGTALALVALLVATVGHDPAFGVTRSTSPFSDEGFNAVNARNLALLGRFSTDGWNLHLVNLPFSLVLAAVFEAFGAGIVQARLACIAMVGLTVALLGIGLRRPFGPWPAALAALAYATSTLVLYYGRLVYLEDLVSLGLVTGTLALLASRRSPIPSGIVGGVAFAIAIGTKPSAGFAVAGLLAALAIVEATHDGWLRRWLAAAGATVIAFGLAWVLVIWLPQRDAVATDLRIWAPITWPSGPGDALQRVVAYLHGSDQDAAILESLPLMVLGGVGVVVSLFRARQWGPDQRRLVVAAFGWIAAGTLVLLLVSYRPNRYVVPLLPALAMLGAAGVSELGPMLRPRLGGNAVLALGLVLALVLAAPGLAAHASWTATTPSTLPASQAKLAAVVPRGAVVVGVDAPTLLMSAPVTTIITREGIPGNDGDLYTTAGARWFLALQGRPPAVVTFPAGVWERASLVACAPWFQRVNCLYHVPCPRQGGG
ncbi:MAG TPA: glycosyltransferase family 39 protein, partial [Candidatus Dormibacteraeota bacterium]|nr:glycosyltransferase family 39 protein [Candidatus Dormibacteraeota bacterium]